MVNRIAEIMALAEAGDEEIVLQVASEIALQPESPYQIAERLDAQADDYFEQFAPIVSDASDEVIDQLADDAGF